MITLLTSELNRINQGCGKWLEIQGKFCGELESKYTGLTLCPTCQKEKETLKKVSLMWADFVLKNVNFDDDDYNDLIVEVEQIKFLMEKA